MATTTASFSLNSPDLLSTGTLALSTSSVLNKTGSTFGLEQVQMGRLEISPAASATNNDTLFKAVQTSVITPHFPTDKNTWIYISNLETDAALYVELSIKNVLIGHLYAGDFMFIPWCPAAVHDDIEIDSSSGSQTIEYSIFHEGIELVAGADA